MENINIVSSNIIEKEICIKLIDYLKRNNIIDDRLYHFCINKYINN